MKNIQDLEDYCNKAVSISKNELYLWLISFYKTLTNNKNLLAVYDEMIEILNKPYVSEFSDPASIAEKHWGIGSREMFSDTFYIHEVYYASVITDIKVFFLNEMFVLSSDKNFQVQCQYILNNLETFFTIPRKYTKNEKSTFHHDSSGYAQWKNTREKTQEAINENIQNLKKLVDKYS